MFLYYNLFNSNIITQINIKNKYTHQEQVEEHLELKLSPNFGKIENQLFLQIVATFCTLIKNIVFL